VGEVKREAMRREGESIWGEQGKSGLGGERREELGERGRGGGV